MNPHVDQGWRILILRMRPLSAAPVGGLIVWLPRLLVQGEAVLRLGRHQASIVMTSTSV